MPITEVTPITPSGTEQKPEVKVEAKVEPPKVETKVEEKKADEKKTEVKKEAVVEQPQPKDSQRYAQFARREQQLVQQQREIAQAREQLAQQYQEIQQFGEIQKQAKLNPIGVLEALGITREELGNYILNDEKPTPDLQYGALQQEIEALRQEREQERAWLAQQLEAQQQEQARQEEAQVLEGFNAEVSTFVKEHPDDYELILAYEQQPLVTQVIAEAFEANGGELISHKEAADMVEQFLIDQVEKASKTKKFGAKLGQNGNGKQGSTAQQAQAKTLSNTHSATTPVVEGSSPSYEQERMARAIAAAERVKNSG